MIDLNSVIARTDYEISYTSVDDCATKLAIALGKTVISITVSSTSYTAIDMGNNICIYFISNGSIRCATFSDTNAANTSYSESVSSINTSGGILFLTIYKSTKMLEISGSSGIAVFVNFHQGMWGQVMMVSNSCALIYKGTANTITNILIKDDSRKLYYIPYSLSGISACENLYGVSNGMQLTSSHPTWFEEKGVALGMRYNMVFCL